jgi:hypothetical protein
VTIADENRRGLLGQGSVLAVTFTQTARRVVLRGKCILENILARRRPLSRRGPAAQGVKPATMASRRRCGRPHGAPSRDARLCDVPSRDGSARLLARELRRDRPLAAARSRRRVDASGQLADGTPVDGPVALRKALMKHPEQFVRTMTEKMLTYALGRGLEYYDMPIVRQIARDASAQNYKFSSIVLGIVKSTPFLKKLKATNNLQVATNN